MNKREHVVYVCRSKLIPGAKYNRIAKIAWRIFNEIKRKTKRRPYIRSAYFDGKKIFLDNFWPHLLEKHFSDRVSRLKFFPCAIELIRKATLQPLETKEGRSNKVMLYRFLGKVGDQFFIVQIKEDIKRDQRYFMSVFSYTKK